ncbi:putative holin-like toxin [Heyndrickxia sporothermodurans]
MSVYEAIQVMLTFGLLIVGMLAFQKKK